MNLRILVIFLFVVVNASDTCETDNDCLDLNSCVDGVCVHKDLFPMATIEYAGSIVMIVIAIIANAGGIGGSSITISLMLLLFKYDAHASVALTQVFIFAGTTTATILKLKDRHPTRDRPLIYYDVLMQIISPILLGVSIGVLLNPSFPSWLILALLTIVVVFLLIDVVNRGTKIYKKERNLSVEVVPSLDPQIERENNEVLVEKAEVGEKESTHVKGKSDIHSNLNGEDEPVENSINSANYPEKNENNERNGNIENSDPVLLRKITKIYENEKKIIALGPLIYFIVLAGVSILVPLLKGSSKTSSIIGIKPCSLGYFMLNAGYCIFMLIMNLFASIHLIQKTSVCEQTNYEFDEGDIRWNAKKCLLVSLVGILAGIVVGLLGMGGGNLIGPMLLSLGVRPEISTISSSFSIFISSGTASAQFFIAGAIDIKYSGLFFVLSCIGSSIGILVLRKYAIKKQRTSTLVFCLAIILFASLIIIPTVGIMNAMKQSEQGTLELSFNSIC